MSAVRIIGIGSPFGGDRVGWDAIDAIDHSGLLARFRPGSVETFRCGTPAAGLLPLVGGAAAAILIDATRSGATPGTVRKIDVHQLQPDGGKISSHGLGVSECLALAETLGVLPAATVIYGIEVSSTGESAAPTAGIHAAIPRLMRKIARELQNLVRNGVLTLPPPSRTRLALPLMP